MNARPGRTLRHTQGSVIIEFAIVLPVIVFLMMAMFEFAHFFYQYKIIVNQVRNTARVLTAQVVDSGLSPDAETMFYTGRPGCSDCQPIFPGFYDYIITVASVDRAADSPEAKEARDENISWVNLTYNEFEYTPVFDMFSPYFAGKKLTVGVIMRQVY